MQKADNRHTLAVGLIGGILGALLVASMPAVTAAIGDAVTIGESNRGNATTILRSAADPTLRLVNTSGGTALDLRVGQGNRPLTVDSNKRVPKLNADRVDGRNANQLLRVARGVDGNPPDQDGAAATATITAPTDGYLVMSGSIEVSGNSRDAVLCSLAVQRGTGTSWQGHHEVIVHNPGDGHTSNARNVCSTDAVRQVPRGTYDVSIWIDFRVTASLKGATVWVMFVPFDGEGNLPENPDW